MLLKLNSKVKNYCCTLFSLLILALLFTKPVTANEALSNAWQLHGFVAQGMVNVNGSDFVNDDQELSFKMTEIGINTSYQYSTNLRLTAQVVYLNGGNRYSEGARVDYALIDWTVYNDPNWLIKAYLGRYKNNHWLYSSTRDVPHTRPSIILPQSLYFDGFRDIAMGSDGGAIRVSYSDEKWGNFDFDLSYGSSSSSVDDTKLILGDAVQGKGDQKFAAQASMYWQPDYSPWRFGVAFLDSDFDYLRQQDEPFANGFSSFQQHIFTAAFEGEHWQFSGEIQQTKFLFSGFYFPEHHSVTYNQGAYIQSRYKYNEKLSFLARVERFYNNKNDKNGRQLERDSAGMIPAYFGFQHDITVGASFDLSEKLRINIEFHQVEGTSRLTPITFPNTKLNDSKHWNLWALQLMYWF